MIKIIEKNKDFDKNIKEIIDRNKMEFHEVNKIVENILKNVKEKGDVALYEYTKNIDKVELDNICVTKEEMDKAYDLCDKELINALEKAKENIWKYHSKEMSNSWMMNKEDGAILGKIHRPIEKVGIYVPGGTAPYPSTVLMNAIPAKVAGVDEIIMVTPPSKDKSVNKSILAAAKIAGVDKIFKVGGAQGIGALAYGTKTIPKVYKIVGPGNIYVAMAKRMVYGYVDIDMIAGPSEILIIAEEGSNEKFIAADLLSQAEHDTLASSILITTSKELAHKVKEEIKIQTEKLERKDIIKKSLNDFGLIIVVDTLQEAVEISNKMAPEHLELMVKNPFELLGTIKNAGGIFLGEYSPEPLGDYIAGPNHTLPTSGSAKFFSPLGVEAFIKKSSFVYYTKEALLRDKENIVKIATKEGLTAHANSIKVRF